MDIKAFIKNAAEKEKHSHMIVNIMSIALLSLVIIFTLCFGVKADIGSTAFDDGKEYPRVRQNLFQLIDTVFSSTMGKEEAVRYIESVNTVLLEKYGVAGFNTVIEPALERQPAFGHLGEFGILAQQLGKNAHKVNLLKYKLVYSLAVADVNTTAHRQSLDGHRITAMSGQLILMVLPQLALLLIAAVFLVFSIIALVKKKPNKRVKFMLILLMICNFVNIVLFSAAGFLAMNWAGYLVMSLVFLCAVFYVLIIHAVMEREDFSSSMLVRNGVFLLGGLTAFALFMSPIFKLTSAGGNTTNLGWAYLMDYALTENAYMSAVMSYTLTEFLMLALMLLPATLLIIFMLSNTGRFLSADYKPNEPRVFLIITAAVNFLIFLIMGVTSLRGGLNITSQFAQVSLNFGLAIAQFLVVAGLIAFEILYKAKPIKKELVIK